MFAPTPIGEKTVAKQVYELYNGGSLPVKYELDLTPLEMLQEVSTNFVYLAES